LVVILLVWGCVTPIPLRQTPEAADGQWLLGTWTAEQWIGTTAFQAPYRVEVAFKLNGEAIVWQLEIVSAYGYGSKASGTTSVLDRQLALEGKYTDGPFKGAPLSYSLTRSVDGRLEGTGVGSQRAVFRVVWEKAIQRRDAASAIA
jgi:hypothetical protein